MQRNESRDGAHRGIQGPGFWCWFQRFAGIQAGNNTKQHRKWIRVTVEELDVCKLLSKNHNFQADFLLLGVKSLSWIRIRSQAMTGLAADMFEDSADQAQVRGRERKPKGCQCFYDVFF